MSGKLLVQCVCEHWLADISLQYLLVTVDHVRKTKKVQLLNAVCYISHIPFDSTCLWTELLLLLDVAVSLQDTIFLQCNYNIVTSQFLGCEVI